MNERLCPITGELLPVTDPGRIVSQTACNRLRVATSDLTGLMGVIDALIAGEGHTHAHGSGGVARTRAGLLKKPWIRRWHHRTNSFIRRYAYTYP